MNILTTILSFYDEPQNNKKNDYSECFKLPIEYLEDSKKKLLNANIITDLELKITKENESTNNLDSTEIVTNSNTNVYNLYYHVFDPTNIFEKNILNRWSNYYTNDRDFLIESQELLKNYKPIKKVNFALDTLCHENNLTKEEQLYSTCKSIINDNGFINNYQYIDIPFLDKYNNNSMLLQFLSIYNLSSPVFSLLIPIIFLLLPFFIIKLQGYNITFELYFEHLKKVFSNHIIGQMLSSFSETTFTNKLYLLCSFGFYIFQLYLNFTSCIKYFTNIKYINNTLLEIKDYVSSALQKYNNFLNYSHNLKSYNLFNDAIRKNISIFSSYYDELSMLQPYNLNIYKLTELGQLMKCFFYLNKNKSFIESLHFSFGFDGYIKNIEKLQEFIGKNIINYCSYNTNNSSTSFTNAYYANLNSIQYNKSNNTTIANVVKNSYCLDKNVILTGPNASGKTTILKSSLFNIILCQQIGCGFFDKAKVKVYDYIHCYINIPDTGGRDSLYQAEARQCKNILELVENNKEHSHFCVFDELYSGTNPEEALSSSFSYLTYLNKFSNLDYILTTHYTKLCKKLNTQNNCYCMNVIKKDSDFIYTYKMKRGISKIKGAQKVLKDLDFPENIINAMN
uniref:DNA mismatch repair proteins mutS family domain-containing protein n=1 Tax=viral metagenome TaxID=1070528 RepID=A0A6C0DWZ5_9ZZZZ